MEKPYPHLLLKPRNGLANGGAGETQPLRGCNEAAAFGGLNENTQRPKLIHIAPIKEYSSALIGIRDCLSLIARPVSSGDPTMGTDFHERKTYGQHIHRRICHRPGADNFHRQCHSCPSGQAG
ncbi:protein of unknown function [Agrobacterium pusense]|uniref:Uncharacterized protein n=1 Tax=Agrobacterium pusense TaxID=648995 RepID=U4Q0A7_9HYPH|nr:protein of unknown function [Agrobacterium pusense]